MPITELSKLKEEILAIANTEQGGFPFCDLMSMLSMKGYTTIGDIACEIRPNLVAWHGMSQALVDALAELQAEQKIVLKAVSALVYLTDGQVLQLRVATKIKDYVTPRWLPCHIVKA